MFSSSPALSGIGTRLRRRITPLSVARIVGNMLFLVGYVVLLFGSVEAGVWIRLIGNALSWPYFTSIRMWDMMTLRGFFAFVEAAKLVEIYFM